MKLLEINGLLEEIRRATPVKVHTGGTFARVVASEVFDESGSYDLVIKLTDVDGEDLGMIADIADKHHLAIRPMENYWIIYKPKAVCELIP